MFSGVLPSPITTPLVELMVPVEATVRIPPLTVIGPVKVLALENVSTPAPFLVMPPAPPPITPLMMVFPVPLTISKLVRLLTLFTIVSVLVELFVHVCAALSTMDTLPNEVEPTMRLALDVA